MNQILERLRKDFTPQIGLAGSTILKLLHETLRVKVVGSLPTNEPCIVSLWHGEQQLLLPFSRKVPRLAVLTSLSQDGELQSAILEGLGLEVLRGSSSRGGRSGLLNLVRHVRTGGSVALAVDGPRGPRHQVKAGALELAKLTGAPVVAARASTNRAWSLSRTWDGFLIPKPGARITITFGAPIHVPRRFGRDELDIWVRRLQDMMSAHEVSS